jgi:hypothetical protein
VEVVRCPKVAFSDFSPDGWCDVCGTKVEYEKDQYHPFTCRCYERYLRVQRLKTYRPVLSLRRALP